MSEHEIAQAKTETTDLPRGEPRKGATESAGFRTSLRQLLVLLTIAAALLLAIWILGGKAAWPPAASVSTAKGGSTERVAPEVGSLAPEFTLKDLQGQEVKLSSLRGHTVLINFWATWCPPCRTEMPDLDAFYQDNQQRGIVVLAINMHEDKDVVDRFVHSTGVTLPVLIDADGAAATAYNVNYLPTSFFVDPNGIIREMHIGAMNRSTMEFKAQQAR